MEEVPSSILGISTSLVDNAAGSLIHAFAETWTRTAFTLGGLIAGEGHFGITTKHPAYADGTPRHRFVFELGMAARDEPLVQALRCCLGFGSITRQKARHAHWQPTSRLKITSLRAHQAATIPFCEHYLPPTAKRRQFERWRDALEAYDDAHPHRHGKGASTCSEPGCSLPVRGRGLCRKHYYRATGY